MLSVCIIVRDGEKNICKCLEHIKKYGLETVVVDTGSRDRTKEAALRYTPCVYDFTWCDDFSAAKNYAVSKASNPYVMVIDSDEYIEHLELERLECLLEQNPAMVGRICCRNILGQDENQQSQQSQEWISRIFSRDLFYYTGRIHEQITAKNGKAYETYQAPVQIEHSGYCLTEEQRRTKTLRNIRLLEQELGELQAAHGAADTWSVPEEEKMAYLLYQMGKSHYMAREYDKACARFEQGLSFDLNPKLEFVIDMVETYGYALLNSGRVQDALCFENICGEFGGSADLRFLMGLIYMNNECFEAAVREFQEAAEYQSCGNLGVNSYLAHYNTGVIYECLGQPEEAVRYYKKCGDYIPAKRQLEQLLKQ